MKEKEEKKKDEKRKRRRRKKEEEKGKENKNQFRAQFCKLIISLKLGLD